MRDGEKVERAFLPRLREQLMHDLQAEMERRRDEISEQESTEPQRPSREAQRLRAEIERIDRRLATLEAESPSSPPGAD